MRTLAALVLTCLATSVAAQTAVPPSARPLSPGWSGVWEMVEQEPTPGVLVESLWMRLEVDGNWITQSDSLLLPDGKVEARRFTSECFLLDVDRSRRRPGLTPAVVPDVVHCLSPDVDGVHEGGYGQVAVEGNSLTLTLPMDRPHVWTFRRVE